ncbi:MAG: hypothetical protein CMD35_00145 [Flavobacteriales bacterium]|nr:hypothetical protein [Flavobacteriales bacterium]|tara:strand:+ start:344 stop:1171 length:828 start_codon:yes stop_codon:yes gene_type:complete
MKKKTRNKDGVFRPRKLVLPTLFPMSIPFLLVVFAGYSALDMWQDLPDKNDRTTEITTLKSKSIFKDEFHISFQSGKILKVDTGSILSLQKVENLVKGDKYEIGIVDQKITDIRYPNGLFILEFNQYLNYEKDKIWGGPLGVFIFLGGCLVLLGLIVVFFPKLYKWEKNRMERSLLKIMDVSKLDDNLYTYYHPKREIFIQFKMIPTGNAKAPATGVFRIRMEINKLEENVAKSIKRLRNSEIISEFDKTWLQFDCFTSKRTLKKRMVKVLSQLD